MLAGSKAARTGVEPGGIPIAYIIEAQPDRYQNVALMTSFTSCLSARDDLMLTQGLSCGVTAP